jgi:hypothetical protein
VRIEEAMGDAECRTRCESPPHETRKDAAPIMITPRGAWDPPPAGLIAVVLFGLSTIAACTAPPAPRFIVTATPIDIGVGTQVCIAVDPADPRGVWWWQPGRLGCATRSTGPGVIAAERPAVARPTPDAIDVSFQVGRHVGPPADVRLFLISGGTRMRSIASGAEVATERRADLNVPEAVGAPPR